MNERAITDATEVLGVSKHRPKCCTGKTLCPEYKVWVSMRRRCKDSRYANFDRYGGCGVSVCQEWDDRATGFEAFVAHIGSRPSMLHSVDRIDNARGYEPGNVRWATRKEQAENRKSTVFLTINGETLTKSDWARRCGLSKSSLQYRLAHGWSPAEAVSDPAKGRRQ